MLIKDAENVPNKGYRFSIPLAAKEASDTIAVKMFDGQGNPIRIKGGRGDDYTKNGVEYTLMKYFTWLESDNTLRLYLNFKEVDPSDFSYEIDGTPAVLHKRSDGMRYLALDTGVYSNKLQETHTYSISDSTSTYTITASVLTFARSCTIRDDGPDTVKNLGKALYLYNAAAIDRFGD